MEERPADIERVQRRFVTAQTIEVGKVYQDHVHRDLIVRLSFPGTGNDSSESHFVSVAGVFEDKDSLPVLCLANEIACSLRSHTRRIRARADSSVTLKTQVFPAGNCAQP